MIVGFVICNGYPVVPLPHIAINDVACLAYNKMVTWFWGAINNVCLLSSNLTMLRTLVWSSPSSADDTAIFKITVLIQLAMTAAAVIIAVILIIDSAIHAVTVIHSKIFYTELLESASCCSEGKRPQGFPWQSFS